MLKPRHIAVALLAAIAVQTSDLGASAEPLKADECKALKAKKLSLLTPTVKAALIRGPDWVKEHLHSQEEIEKVRTYLQVEEKVAFRCRTDGVRRPGPRLAPLPDRKPPVPTYVVEGTPQVLAGVAASSFLPLRKPVGLQPDTAGTVETGETTETSEASAAANNSEPDSVGPDAAAGDSDNPGGTAGTVEQAASNLEDNTAPSQAVADSDKTAAPNSKATQ